MAVSDYVNFVRRFDRLLELETKHGKAIEKLEAELDKLKDRVTRLEAREEVVVTEAKAAAGAAATQVAIASVSDIARRIGRLEERGGQKRLDTPE